MVMSLLGTEHHLKNDGELQELLDLFKSYFILKINNIVNFNTDEFKKNYEICSRLAILKITYAKKSGLCCIK
jgi:hypothetical protein